MSTVKKLYIDLKQFYNCSYLKYNLQNPLFCINGNHLTWNNYLPKESFYTYEEYFDWVVNNNQYSLVILDNLLLQIFYEEKNAKIVKGSLTFLPNPDSMMSYFRFDMDTQKAKDFYHNSYHINFGYNSDDVRFTLFKFPYPSEFIKFALFLSGRSEFTKHSQSKYFTDLRAIGESFSHFLDFVTI